MDKDDGVKNIRQIESDASEKIHEIFKNTSPKSKRVWSKVVLYKIIGQALCFVGFVCGVGPVIGMSIPIGSIGAGLVCFGFLFLIFGLGETAQRIKSLPPPPSQPFIPRIVK